MAQPVTPPQVEVLGRSVMAIVGGMRIAQDRAQKILATHGISPLQAEAWYPLSSVLGAFRAIQEQIGPSTMRSVGRQLPDHAKFPSEIPSIESALRAINAAYRMNHRGIGDIGGYHYEARGARSARMTCDTPYPCAMDEGLIEAMSERFRPKDAFFIRIEHEARSCRERGDLSCAYDISW